MQLGTTGFIQLRLSPELCRQLWVVLFGPSLSDIASESENGRLTVIGRNCQSKAELLQRLSTGSVTYLTTRGSVVSLLCLPQRSKWRAAPRRHSASSPQKGHWVSHAASSLNSHWMVISFLYNAELFVYIEQMIS